MTPVEELKAILNQVDAASIWQPITDERGNLLADGIGDSLDGLPPQLESLDLRGTTVLDIGCNFGHYSFWAHRQGAEHVLGIDNDPLVIKGARLRQKIYGYDRLSFQQMDINHPLPLPGFDMVMLIDFIGKNMVRTGFLPHLLDVIDNLAKHHILMTIRPRYKIVKHLGGDRESLLAAYSCDFIDDRYFNVFDYIQSRFQCNWHMSVIERDDAPENTFKEALYLERRQIDLKSPLSR